MRYRKNLQGQQRACLGKKKDVQVNQVRWPWQSVREGGMALLLTGPCRLLVCCPFTTHQPNPDAPGRTKAASVVCHIHVRMWNKKQPR